ncbi:MAG: hypothetical protein JW843_01415 [Candidatus Aminicenantes bacterium]|nr:hypothetical protein [Candidatus Aminicenantes bacterium]
MNALLIIGSPKGKTGTSYALGGALLARLAAAGWETAVMTAATALSSLEKQEDFGRAADRADLILFSFPLYVDQLPAPVIRSIEVLAGRQAAKNQKIAAVIQCGFPETHQNQPAVDIMRIFAQKTGRGWAGALAMGMGGAVGRRPLDKAKGIQKNTVKALDLAAASLASGGDIPEEASVLFAKPLMPKALYFAAANFGMKIQARQHGAGKRVYDRPYD